MVLERASTGVEGLDDILEGGLVRRRAYLIRGGPGSGKTTLGLNFLAAAAEDERALFVGFQESEEQLRANAAAVGIDVSRIAFLSLAPDEHFFTERQGYDVFSAADVEQEPLAAAMMAAVEPQAPARVFVDSLSQLRFLSADIFQYRKQVLSFLRYLTERGATVLFSSESSTDLPDDDLQFIADGVIAIEQGARSTSLRVQKFRGSGFRRGSHQMRVSANGFQVFARALLPKVKLAEDEPWRWKSGVADIDAMLHGGLEAGTMTLITGPSGVGKTTLAALFAAEAAKQGRRAAMFLFEEEVAALVQRSRALHIDLEGGCSAGDLFIEQVEPMRYLADEFAMRVHRDVEERGVELVVLDSIAGFELSLDGEDVKERLHAFVKGLSRIGVSVLLVNETEVMMGAFRISDRGISYLSDNIIFMRYMEFDGELHKALGVLKKRLSAFDSNLHTFRIGPRAINVGNPISGVQGVLAGTPVPQESDGELLE